MRERENGIDAEAIRKVLEEERETSPIWDFIADSLAEVHFFQERLDLYQKSLIENGTIEYEDSFNLGRAFTFRMVPPKWKIEPLVQDEISEGHDFLFDKNNRTYRHIGRAFKVVDRLSPEYNDWQENFSGAIPDTLARLDFTLGGMTTILAFHMRELKRMGIDPHSFPED